MKILYSQIKELVPGLEASAKAVGEALTLTGFMMDGLTEVSYKNKPDWLISLEIRQNRADCLSVFGLAREVAAYYGLKAKLPKIKKPKAGREKLAIGVSAEKYVKRITALKITGIKNNQSPDWLKEYVAFHGLNSVNLLVDLSNYVMFLTGYPSHLIDADKISGGLAWTLNQDFDKTTTLLGAEVALKRDQELIIRDQHNLIALAGIVGAQAAEISDSTRNLIAEAAVYDRSIIRKNSRGLNIVTEASHRLEKELDPNGAQAALELLCSLIGEYAGGRVSSQLFDYYPVKYVSPTVEFDPASVSRFAGIDIPKIKAVKILHDLNFTIKKSGQQLLVAPPTYRQDIALNEDLVEEVIRLNGYDKIPADDIPRLPAVREITPKNILLAEKAKDLLTALGYDEILSWPLTKRQDNELTNYLDWQAIATQNSINNLFPDLRQTLATGLIVQLNEYFKKNVEFIKIFESGKIFGQQNDKYLEHESLAMLSASQSRSLAEFKNHLETLLRSLGLIGLKYEPAAFKPAAANPASAWDIYAGEKKLGILYKFRPQENKLNAYFAEINLTLATAILNDKKNNSAVELTQKLISLDANIELNKDQSIYRTLDELEKKFDQNHLWSLSVADVYPLAEKIRYTVRAVYQELSDQEAKKIHQKIFNL